MKTFTLNISVSAIEKYQHESKQLLSIHHPHGDSKNFSVNALIHIIKTLEKFLQLPQPSRLPLILCRLQKKYIFPKIWLAIKLPRYQSSQLEAVIQSNSHKQIKSLLGNNRTVKCGISRLKTPLNQSHFKLLLLFFVLFL